MSNPGARADEALDNEVVDEVEIEQGADESGSDEDGADALDEEPGDDGDDHSAEDTTGDHEGQARQPGEVAAKPRSAATIAVQEAKRAAKEARAEAEATRREMAELRAAAQGRQTAEQQRLEQERLALMPPEEKYEYLLNRQAEQTRVQLGAIEFRMQDAADRSAFESMCARRPAFAAVQAEVEETLANFRRQGQQGPSRENLALWAIGKNAVSRAEKGGKTKQAVKGAQRVQSQRVAAPASRSDVQGGQRRSGGETDARRQRLENMDI